MAAEPKVPNLEAVDIFRAAADGLFLAVSWIAFPVQYFADSRERLTMRS